MTPPADTSRSVCRTVSGGSSSSPLTLRLSPDYCCYFPRHLRAVLGAEQNPANGALNLLTTVMAPQPVRPLRLSILVGPPPLQALPLSRALHLGGRCVAEAQEPSKHHRAERATPLPRESMAPSFDFDVLLSYPNPQRKGSSAAACGSPRP